jgi:hypothetical protein
MTRLLCCGSAVNPLASILGCSAWPTAGRFLCDCLGKYVAITRKMAMGVDRWKTVDCVVSGQIGKDLPRLAKLRYGGLAGTTKYLSLPSYSPCCDVTIRSNHLQS